MSKRILQKRKKRRKKRGLEKRDSQACEWEHENMAREEVKCAWHTRRQHSNGLRKTGERKCGSKARAQEHGT